MKQRLRLKLFRRSRHDRITSVFLALGAILPIGITFALVYYAPHLYDDQSQTIAPLVRRMRAYVEYWHDARALNAFDVSLGGGALLSTYIGIVVARLLGLIQKFVERRLGEQGQEIAPKSA
ncbi:MAG: hypothetical protein WAU68_00475 [Vitreimonas sp.]